MLITYRQDPLYQIKYRVETTPQKTLVFMLHAGSMGAAVNKINYYFEQKQIDSIKNILSAKRLEGVIFIESKE